MKTIKNVEDVKSLDIIAEFKKAKKIYFDTVEDVCGSITAYNNPEQSNKIDKVLKKYDKKFYINNHQFLELSIIDASFEKYGIGRYLSVLMMTRARTSTATHRQALRCVIHLVKLLIIGTIF